MDAGPSSRRDLSAEAPRHTTPLAPKTTCHLPIANDASPKTTCHHPYNPLTLLPLIPMQNLIQRLPRPSLKFCPQRISNRNQSCLREILKRNPQYLSRLFFIHQMQRSPGRSNPLSRAANIKLQVAGRIEPHVPACITADAPSKRPAIQGIRNTGTSWRCSAR